MVIISFELYSVDLNCYSETLFCFHQDHFAFQRDINDRQCDQTGCSQLHVRR